jgi:hypothetical protein
MTTSPIVGLIDATEDTEPPIISARRIDGQLVITCPWCGKKHHHGAGTNIGDGDGHRVAHSTDNKNPGYVLCEVSS